MYADRQAVIRKDEDRELWEQLDFNYMTDYSEGEEDDEVLHYHHISWRSDSKLIIHTVSKLYIKNHRA